MTTVFYAGNVGNRPVVSIFTNGPGQTGSNLPVTNPTSYFDRVHLDSRFDNIEVISVRNFSYTFGAVDGRSLTSPTIVTTDTNIFAHGISQGTSAIGYEWPALITPGFILYDIDTNEVIGSNMIVQVVEDTSFRSIGLLMDESNVYIRERYVTYGQYMPSMTKRYSLLTLKQEASVQYISPPGPI